MEIEISIELDNGTNYSLTLSCLFYDRRVKVHPHWTRQCQFDGVKYVALVFEHSPVNQS